MSADSPNYRRFYAFRISLAVVCLTGAHTLPGLAESVMWDSSILTPEAVGFITRMSWAFGATVSNMAVIYQDPAEVYRYHPRYH